jgi:iturin family lipopeptide synthetase A
MSSPACLLGLTAVDERKLRQAAAALASTLRDNAQATSFEPHQDGKARLLVLATTADEIARELSAFASGERTVSLKTREHDSPPRIAFIFAGQSETRAGMGGELYRQSPSFASVIDRCSSAMGATLGTTLASALYDSEDPSLLDDARIAQPALFALQVALVAQWQSWGVLPELVAGHSLGEYAAACAAGVMTLEDGARLVAARGALTQSLALPGLMAVVFASEEWVSTALESYDDNVSIAAINAPQVVVVSGETKAITEFLASADAEGVSAKPLNISHPFHSRCIDPILGGLADLVAGTALSEPQIPFASTLEGRLLDRQEVPDASYWSRHAREPVRFLDTMCVLERAGCTVFLEIGPHATLTKLGARCVDSDLAQWLPSLKRSGQNWQVLSATATELWLAGAPVDLAKMTHSVGWQLIGPTQNAPTATA